MEGDLFLGDDGLLNFEDLDNVAELPDPIHIRPQSLHGSGQHTVAGTSATRPQAAQSGPQDAIPGDYSGYVSGSHAGQQNVSSGAYGQQHVPRAYNGQQHASRPYNSQPSVLRAPHHTSQQHPPGTYNAQQSGLRAYNSQQNGQANTSGPHSSRLSGSFGLPSGPAAYTGHQNTQNRPYNKAARLHTGNQYSVPGPTSFRPPNRPRSPWKPTAGTGFKAKPLGSELQEVQRGLENMRSRMEDLEKRYRSQRSFVT
jgi:hypothetical protein